MCLTAADDHDELASQAADFDAALDVLPEVAPLAGGHSEPHEMLPLQLPPLPQHLLDVQPSPAPEMAPRYENAPSAPHQEGMAAAEPANADSPQGVELVFEDLPAERAAFGSDAAGWAAGSASTPHFLDDAAPCSLGGSNGADASVLAAASGPLQRLRSIATSYTAVQQNEGAAASKCSPSACGGPLPTDAPAVAQAHNSTMPAAVPPTGWPAIHTAEQPQLGWQQQAPVRSQQHTVSCQMQAFAAGAGWGDDANDCIPIIDDDDDASGCATITVADGGAGAVQTPSSPAVQQPAADEQPVQTGSASVRRLAASDAQSHDVPCSNSAAAVAAAAAAGATALPWSPTLSGVDGAQQGAAEGTRQGANVAASPCKTEEPTPAASPQLSISDAGGESGGGGGCEIVFDEVVDRPGSGVGVAAGTPVGPREAATGMVMAPQSGADRARICRWLVQTACNAASCAASASHIDTISHNCVAASRADNPQARQTRSAGSRAQGVQVLRA